MATIRFTMVSEVSAAAFLDALTDFSERRPERWPNLDRRYYTVHMLGETRADVTEGSAFLGGVWERDVYDWSRPNTVRITVLESNAFAPGSYWEYRVEPTATGGSRIAFSLRRVGRGAKGRFLDVLLRVFGRRIFRQDVQRSLARLAQEGQPAPATAARD